MSVGTIVSEMSVSVVMSGGGRLGSIEESFIARLRPGDRFAFAGRALEFVAMRDMTAWVRSSPSHEGLVPRWHGSRMGMSPVLAEAVRAKLDEAGRGTFASPELAAVRPLLELQALWSGLPARDELLVETYQSGEGHHLFVFPFEGRQVHEGLAALLARRLAARRPTTFTMAFNDYGLELLSPSAIPFAEAMADGLLAEASLAEDVMAGLNAMEMARRTFREIARIAGLVFQGYPGRGKTARQLQSTASLFFEVFVKYDPDNLLLRQAFREAALGRHEEERLRGALARLRAARLLVKRLRRPSPLSFPLMVDHLRDRLSTERLADRVRTMQLTLEREADLSLKTGSAGKAGEG
jgi:ATP-dependent Lhr-like helicase